jgi:hypothetical protein
LVNQEEAMAEAGADEEDKNRKPSWSGYTPAGQHLVVEPDDGGWVVSCNEREPVRNRVLDVALIEAISSDVHAHWSGSIDRAQWTRLIADSILRTFPSAEPA